MDVIRNKSQIKWLKRNCLKQRRFDATVHLLLQVFSWKGCLGCHHPNAFSALFLDQMRQNVYQNDHLTSDYTLVWSVLANWHHRGGDTASKWPTWPTPLLQQTWQPMMPTLNRWLRSFYVEPRANIWH
jgi:hypothetical protein